MYFDPKEVGKRIAKLRELLGYNQEQYSQKINISRSALSKIEIGDRSPSIDLLIEIAELSGVTLDYLILGRTPQEGNKKLGMQLVISFLTELEKEL
jgi:bacteriophage CI repressor helix-turn-helix domain